MYKMLRVLVIAVLLIAFIPGSHAYAPVWNYDIDGITAVAMSPNEEYVAVGTEEGDIYLLNRFGELLNYKSIVGSINCVDIANNASIIVGTEGKLSFYNPLEEKVFVAFDRDSVLSCDISADGKNGVVGTADSVFLLSEEGLRQHTQYNARIENILLASEGIDYICSSDKFIIFGEKVIQLDSHVTEIAKFDGYVACGTRGGVLYVFNESGDELWEKDIGSQINAVDIINQYIALAADRVYLFDFEQNELGNFLLGTTPVDIQLSEDFIVVISDRLSLLDFYGNGLWYYKAENLKAVELFDKGENLVVFSGEDIYYFNLYTYEILLTYFNPYPSRTGNDFSNFKRVDEFPQIGDVQLGNVQTGDVNGDGEDEIVGVVRGENTNTVIVLDRYGNELRKKSFDKKIYLKLLDVNNDMNTDIIMSYCEAEKIFMNFYDGSFTFINEIIIDLEKFEGRELTRDETLNTAVGSPIMSLDIDNDNLVELICVMATGYPKKPRGILLLEYPSGDFDWYYAIASSLMTPTVSDINNDGIIEIVTGTVAPCNTNEEGDTNDCHAYVIAIDENGNELWIHDFGQGFIRANISVDDIDNDEFKETIVSAYTTEGSWGRLVILDSAGTPVSNKDLEFGYATWWNSIADFDDDGYKEIITGNSDNMIRIYDYNLNLLKEEYVDGITRYGNSIINDINGDGAKEIIIWTDRGNVIVFDHNFNELWREKFESLERVITINISKCTNDLLILADKLHLYSFATESQQCALTTDIFKLRPQKRLEYYEDIADRSSLNRNYRLSKDYHVMAINVAEQLGDSRKKNEILEKLKTIDFYLEAEIYFEKGVNYLESRDCKEADINLRIAKLKFTGLYDLERIDQIDELLSSCQKCFEAEKKEKDAGYWQNRRKYGDAVKSYEQALISYQEIGFTDKTAYIENEIEYCRKIELISWISLSIALLVFFFFVLARLVTRLNFLLRLGPLEGSLVKSFLCSLLTVSILIYFYPDAGIIPLSGVGLALYSLLLTVFLRRLESRKEIYLDEEREYLKEPEEVPAESLVEASPRELEFEQEPQIEGETVEPVPREETSESEGESSQEEEGKHLKESVEIPDISLVEVQSRESRSEKELQIEGETVEPVPREETSESEGER